MNVIDSLCLDILDDLLAHGGEFFDEPGRVLTRLAERVHCQEVRVGHPLYHRTSLAVLRLESLGLITVERQTHDESHKANIVLGIRLT